MFSPPVSFSGGVVWKQNAEGTSRGFHSPTSQLNLSRF